MAGNLAFFSIDRSSSWSNHIVKSCFVRRSLWCWAVTRISLTLKIGFALCSWCARLMSIKLPTKNTLKYKMLLRYIHVYKFDSVLQRSSFLSKERYQAWLPMCWFYFLPSPSELEKKNGVPNAWEVRSGLQHTEMTWAPRGKALCLS